MLRNKQIDGEQGGQLSGRAPNNYCSAVKVVIVEIVLDKTEGVDVRVGERLDVVNGLDKNQLTEKHKFNDQNQFYLVFKSVLGCCRVSIFSKEKGGIASGHIK